MEVGEPSEYVADYGAALLEVKCGRTDLHLSASSDRLACMMCPSVPGEAASP